MNVFGTVYVLLNIITEKVYVGQTIKSPDLRRAEHIYKANGGCAYPLHRAIRKYGAENFIISMVVECEDKNQLDNKEMELISLLGGQNKFFGYNVTMGGEGGSPFLGHAHTEESKKKTSLALIGRKKHPGFGAKVSAGLKGKPKSAEHKEKLSGKNNPMFGRVGSLNPMFGKKRPDLAKRTRENHPMLGKPCSETRRKAISEALKGRIFSEETKRRMSESAKKRIR